MIHQAAKIKPIVLFGISEHFKRKTIHLNSTDFILVGLIYGTRQGRDLIINFSSPIKATNDPKQNKIEKAQFEQYLQKSDKLIRVDHPGNNLRSLSLVGVYILRKDLTLNAQDAEIFGWLKHLGFENQRLLLINFEKERLTTYLFRMHNKQIVPVPFTHATEQSEGICINALMEKSNASPYESAMQNHYRQQEKQYSLIENYEKKLEELLVELKKETDLEKLRQVNEIITNLDRLAGHNTIIDEVNSNVVFDLVYVMSRDRNSLYY